MKYLLCFLALLFGIPATLRAQDISGDWQGAIGSGKGRLRVILHIDKAEDGGWKAKFFSIDQGADGMPVDSITQHGSEVAFSMPDIKLSYKGTISTDVKSIVGKMTQDGTGAFTFVRATPETAWPHDIQCSCSISFVEVERGVKLEVVDWGGTGRPLVLLAGLGNTAHSFDVFAHKLTPQYHLYGITRRGYGESSSPAPTDANYNADRLGDDVLAVIDALHLTQRPVLIGHSVAGEELSSVGSRHPEKVAGLIYLDAAYGYAFYNPAYPDPDIDALTIREKLADFVVGSDTAKSISELRATLPALEKMLDEQQKEWAGVPVLPDPSSTSDFGPDEAIELGQRKYIEIKLPILAIFANPKRLDPSPGINAAGRAAMVKAMSDETENAMKAIQSGFPTAHVIVIPNADHFVYQSNEADVLREINAFLAPLPQ